MDRNSAAEHFPQQFKLLPFAAYLLPVGSNVAVAGHERRLSTKAGDKRKSVDRVIQNTHQEIDARQFPRTS